MGIQLQELRFIYMVQILQLHIFHLAVDSVHLLQHYLIHTIPLFIMNIICSILQELQKQMVAMQEILSGPIYLHNME